MEDIDYNNLPQESHDAVHAARDFAQAQEISRAAILQQHDDRTREIVIEAVKSMDFPSNQELKGMLDSQNQAIEVLSKKLDPILDVYKAVLLSKSFITGLAGIVIGITAIGVGITWVINSVIQK